MTDQTDPRTETDAPETDGGFDSVEAVLAELEALRTDNAALKEQALRYAAEVENIKRRAERENNDARAYAIQKFSQSLLGVADIFERALNSAPVDIADPAFKNFLAGIEMTERELAGAFEKNGVKKIAPMKGDKFDPNLHQAVTEQPSDDVPNGSVLMLMQAGYELFGRVIRPAMVAVSKASNPAPQPSGVDTQA